jgi:hypothetical protein
MNNSLPISTPWDWENMGKRVTFPILRTRRAEANYPLFTNRLQIGKLGKCLYIRSKDLPTEGKY